MDYSGPLPPDTNLAPGFLIPCGILLVIGLSLCVARINSRLRPSPHLHGEDYVIIIAMVLRTYESKGTLLTHPDFFLLWIRYKLYRRCLSVGSSVALCFSGKSNKSLQGAVLRTAALDPLNSSCQNIRDALSTAVEQVCCQCRKTVEVVFVVLDRSASPLIDRMADTFDLQLSSIAGIVGTSTKVDMLGT
jgi:hypothetical protein